MIKEGLHLMRFALAVAFILDMMTVDWIKKFIPNGVLNGLIAVASGFQEAVCLQRTGIQNYSLNPRINLVVDKCRIEVYR
jgi:hypothetical protein